MAFEMFSYQFQIALRKSFHIKRTHPTVALLVQREREAINSKRCQINAKIVRNKYGNKTERKQQKMK